MRGAQTILSPSCSALPVFLALLLLLLVDGLSTEMSRGLIWEEDEAAFIGVVLGMVDGVPLPAVAYGEFNAGVAV